MKTTFPLLLACLLFAQPLRAETLVWWRLEEEAPPLPAAEGGPDLKWWSEASNPYSASESGPPDALYRVGQSPSGRGFAAAASYGSAPGGLLAKGECDFSGQSGGLTVEGFFSTAQVKDRHENQAVMACGDGGMDISWAFRLLDGRPAFAVFRDGDTDPLAQVEIGEDARTGDWHYFVARIHSAASGHPSMISLSVRAADGRAWSEELPLPEGTEIRRHAKPPIVGRSSVFIDTKPDYKGTWDTFQGTISDLRISSGILPDSGLLGVVEK